jgi:hypothetical protein
LFLANLLTTLLLPVAVVVALTEVAAVVLEDSEQIQV